MLMQELVHNTFKLFMRSFPLSRGKIRLLSYLWKPLSFGRYNRQATLRQSSVMMDFDLTKLLQRKLYFLGEYEKENTNYWIKLAKGTTTIFDIGANVGLYSLLAAVENPKATVYAFEPTPEMFDALVRNVQLNDVQNVVVNQNAVGKSDIDGFLHYCAGSKGDNEGMNFVTAEQARETDRPIEIVSLDSYCQQHQIERIDLLKMDIEGGEYDALLGARGLLQAKAIGYIFVELVEWAAKRSGHSTVDIKRILLDADYLIYRLCSGKLVPVQLEQYHDGDDIIAFANPLLRETFESLLNA